VWTPEDMYFFALFWSSVEMKISNEIAKTAKTPKMDPVEIKARRFRFVIEPPFREYLK